MEIHLARIFHELLSRDRKVGKNPKAKIEVETHLKGTSQGATPEDIRLPARLRPRFQPVRLPGRRAGDCALSEQYARRAGSRRVDPPARREGRPYPRSQSRQGVNSSNIRARLSCFTEYYLLNEVHPETCFSLVILRSPAKSGTTNNLQILRSAQDDSMELQDRH